MNFAYPDYYPRYFDADVIYYVERASILVNNIGRKKSKGASEFSDALLCIRNIIMKKKGSISDAKTSRANGESLFWVNVSLSDADVAELEQQLLAPSELLGQLAILLAAGYNISIKHSGEHDHFTVILFGPVDHTANKNKALSARASDLADALNALLFKHYSILGAVWPDKLQREKSRFG